MIRFENENITSSGERNTEKIIYLEKNFHALKIKWELMDEKFEWGRIGLEQCGFACCDCKRYLNRLVSQSKGSKLHL